MNQIMKNERPQVDQDVMAELSRPLDVSSQYHLSHTFKQMKRAFEGFLTFLLNPIQGWQDGFLVIHASKLGAYHAEIRNSLDVLHNGYFLSNRIPHAVKKYDFIMKSFVPASGQSYQDFPMKTKITKKTIRAFLQLIGGQIYIKNGRDMIRELERALETLNTLAEAIDSTTLMATFVSECHLAELTVPAQVINRDNFYDNKKNELGQENFRDRALVIAVLERQKKAREEDSASDSPPGSIRGNTGSSLESSSSTSSRKRKLSIYDHQTRYGPKNRP